MSDEKRRLLVIGLDGVSFEYLNSLVTAGALPYLGRLAAAGSFQALPSVEIPLTAIAWTASYTGTNPGRANIPGFVRQIPNSYRWEYVSPADRAHHEVWRILGDQGYRSVLLGTIFCQNPGAFNGVFIGGEYCGDIARCVSPDELRPVVFDRFGYDPYTSYGSPVEVAAFIENKFRIARYLNERYEWDLFFIGFMEPDTAHAYYHRTDLAFVEDVYRTIDRQLEQFVADIGRPVDVVLYSDHGNRMYSKAFHVNSWLHAQGYLHLRSRAQIRAHHWRRFVEDVRRARNEQGAARAIRAWVEAAGRLLARRLPATHGVLLRIMHLLPEPRRGKPTSKVGRDLQVEIEPGVLFDYGRTRAYASLNHGGNFAGICLNRVGRHPEGTVSDEAYEAVRAEIAQGLRQARIEPGGRPLAKRVWMREELFWGPYADDFPDVIFEVADDHFTYISEDNVSAKNVFLDFPSCQHELNGFLMCSGRPFKQGSATNGRLVDVAATLIYLVGAAVPSALDGHVMTDLLEPSYLADHPVRTSAQGTEHQRPAAEGYTYDEQRLMEQRLRDLGYFE
jgi:predicted AlkP superfamily phosphohydrolase/phosphomutase